MAKTFNNKQRKAGFVKDLKGTGTFIVELDFLPDYLSAKFATQGTQGNQHDGKANATDSIYWELVSSSPTTFVFIVYYTCVHTRDIQYVVSKLPVNAETIAH